MAFVDMNLKQKMCFFSEMKQEKFCQQSTWTLHMTHTKRVTLARKKMKQKRKKSVKNVKLIYANDELIESHIVII